jgi:hypothetical protein
MCHVAGDMQAALLAEATELLQSDAAFVSKESHTVYQEVEDDSYPSCHPRNLLQQSSKRIVDFARLNSHSVRGVIEQWCIFGLIFFRLCTIPLRFYLSFDLTTIQSFQSAYFEEMPLRLARRELSQIVTHTAAMCAAAQGAICAARLTGTGASHRITREGVVQISMPIQCRVLQHVH